MQTPFFVLYGVKVHRVARHLEDDQGNQVCPKCGSIDRTKHGEGKKRTTSCLQCTRARERRRTPKRREYRAAYNETYRAKNGWRRWTRYSLTEDAWNALLETQSGKCAICQITLTGEYNGHSGNIHVDHSHATGAIRGLLCKNCNPRVNDSRDWHLAAIAYLDYHSQLYES